MNKYQIPGWVADYIGIQFKAQGRNKDLGVDCYGLARIVLQNQFSIDLPDYLFDYDPDDVKNKKALGRLIGTKSLDPDWMKVIKGQEQPGDLILLAIAGYPCHVGTNVCHGKMLHIEQDIYSMVEPYYGKKWERRIYCILRHRSMCSE